MTQESHSFKLQRNYFLIEKASDDIALILLDEINKHIKTENYSSDFDYTRAKHSLLRLTIKKVTSSLGGVL